MIWCSVPRSWEILASGRNSPIEILPRVTIISGCIAFSCAFKKGEQVFFSKGVGSLLSGGLHFTELVMNTCSRLKPIDCNESCRSCPDLPTNGNPSSSSLAPGASPMNRMSALAGPIPGTAFVLVLCKSHLVQVFIC